MTDATMESLGRLQDRLDRLRTAAESIETAGRMAKDTVDAAQAVVLTSRDLAGRSQHLVDATASLQALPPAVSALRTEVAKAVETLVATTSEAQRKNRDEIQAVAAAVDQVRVRVGEALQATERLRTTVIYAVIILGILILVGGGAAIAIGLQAK